MDSALTAGGSRKLPNYRRSSSKEARSWLLLVFVASVEDGSIR